MEQSYFDPGSLNHRMELQQGLEASDGCGGLTTNWQTVASIWAALEPISPLSALIAQQQQETARHRVIIRYRDDVQSGWRLAMNDRTFEVLTLHDPDERQRYLILQTKEEGR